MSGKESQRKSKGLTQKLLKTIFKIINKQVKQKNEQNSRYFKRNTKKMYACRRILYFRSV